jgi:hypothetical protein
MFIMSVILIAMIGLPVGLAMTLVTHDLNRLVELTTVGTAICMAVVALTWRWALRHEVASQEAKTPWLHVPSSITTGVDAWGVLRGEIRPLPAVDGEPEQSNDLASAGAEPAEASAAQR